jgi:hypothetical protein
MPAQCAKEQDPFLGRQKRRGQRILTRDIKCSWLYRFSEGHVLNLFEGNLHLTREEMRYAHIYLVQVCDVEY